jgi:sugar O-acyltransferase (sialic acid O-acetyltransferase NeuD family)
METTQQKEIYILGAGGLAREALCIYIDLGKEKAVKGFLEENCKRKGQILNGKIIQDITYLEGSVKKEMCYLVAAIGSTKRQRLIEKLYDKGYRFDTVIHPKTVYSQWLKIGAGSIIAAGSLLTCQIEIGQHVIINLGCKIGHDAKIGDYSTLSPGVKVMGNACLGKGVFVGTNATIIENVKVGDGAVIAAGAVVTKNVPSMALVAGIPANIKKIYSNVGVKPW